MNCRETTYQTPSGKEWDCFIPSVLSFPTGIGDSRIVTPLKPIRERLGMSKQYRTGVATLNPARGRFVVGPPPEQIPECLRELAQYMSLAGDRHVKGWYATIYLLTIHPWADGNGRTGREFYRRQTASAERRDSLRGRLREALARLQPPRKAYEA